MVEKDYYGFLDEVAEKLSAIRGVLKVRVVK